MVDVALAILIGSIWFCVINLSTFAALRFDKAAAMNGWRRIRESNLLFCVALGGSLGGKIAQRKFRHKTQKQPFARWLNFWLVFHFVLVPVALYLALTS